MKVYAVTTLTEYRMDTSIVKTKREAADKVMYVFGHINRRFESYDINKNRTRYDKVKGHMSMFLESEDTEHPEACDGMGNSFLIVSKDI